MKIAIIATVFCTALSAAPVRASDPAEATALLGSVAPVGQQELAAISGRAGLDADAANLALVQNVQVGANSVTGSNSISGSLNATAGITTVFQNTGNNSVFQAATSININMR